MICGERDRNISCMKYLRQEMLRFFAQVRKIHPAVAQHTHILLQLRWFIAVLLQLRDLRHNGVSC